MTIFAAVYPPPNKIEKLLTAINLEYKTFNISIFEKHYNILYDIYLSVIVQECEIENGWWTVVRSNNGNYGSG